MPKAVSRTKHQKPFKGATVFAVITLACYAILYWGWPDRTLLALKAAAKIAVSLSIPLAFVVIVLFLVNVFVRPSQVAGLLGGSSGLTGMLLPLVAGVLSAGPIFAWYPLLKKLKDEGAGEGPIAVFLYSRGIKPFLLPVMISYYGWQYVLVLTSVMVLGSFIIGYSMEVAFRKPRLK